MTFKKLGCLLMKLVLFTSYYFSRKTALCLPLPQRFEQTFTHMKVNIKKFI